MGRAPCCSKVGLHKGPWTPKEDALLTKYIHAHGEGQWKSLPKKAGLLRCGKSCRLRWMNYLRPDIKRGNITPEEDDLIIRLHSLLGNRWSLIAGRLPGRTDNEIKNYWNTHLSKKLRNQGAGTCDATTQNKLAADPDQQEQPTGGGAKKKSNNKKKKNNKQKNDKSKGANNGAAEEEKTQVYLPKPIRIKALSLPRTESGSFTIDSNNSACDASIGSQEKEEEEEKERAGSTTTEQVENYNVLREVGDVGENDGFGFFGDDHDLVNDDRLEMECDSYFATEDHGTLEKLYEEYLQLLNMDHAHYDLGSCTESLLE